jgi:hypothetical protein
MRHSSETIEGCRAEYIDCKTRGRSSPSSWDPHKDTNTNPSLCKTAQIRPLPVASELHPSGWNTWDRPVVGTIPLKSKTGWHTKDAHHIDPKVVTLETSWNTKPIWVLLFFCCGHGDEDHLFPESDTWNSTDVIMNSPKWNASGHHSDTRKQQLLAFRNVCHYVQQRLSVASFQSVILRCEGKWRKEFFNQQQDNKALLKNTRELLYFFW